jgi:hypothetical protein
MGVPGAANALPQVTFEPQAADGQEYNLGGGKETQ